MLSRRWGGVRRTGGVLAALVVLTATLVVAPGPAAAQPTCRPINGVEVCEHEVTDPGEEEEAGSGSGSGSGTRTCDFRGVEVPCQTDDGWYVGDGCYLRAAQPQPDLDPPDDAEPGGAWYIESCRLQTAPGSDLNRTFVWRNAGEVAPNPEELARRALASIGLRSPQIGVAPDPSGAGLVGLPVYLWTETGPQVWGVESASASEAGLVVSITATAVEVEWHLGDGTVRMCPNAGTPYDPSFGGAPSPTCGHRYERPSFEQPDGQYPITARTRWQITYSSNTGVEGAFPHWTQPSTTALTIHELQVVTS